MTQLTKPMMTPETGVIIQESPLNTFKEKTKSFWLSSQRNLVLSAVMAAIVAAIIVVALWSSSQTYRPLYTQQERFDIGEIVSVLEAEGINYRLQEQNGQALVPEGQVAKVRMLLASKGVKAKLPTGFEALKNESSLGTSQFMENARYRHSLEGELVRTIISLDSVVNARVHLAIPRQTLFVRQQAEKPTASVMLELKAGEDLKPEQVEAIVNLVIGSVIGMKSDAVSVVDQYGRLLSADLGSDEMGKMNSKYLDYQKSVEKQIIQRAADMLTPVVGASNFRVQVAAEMNFNHVEETQEIVDNTPVVRTENTVQNNSIDKIAIGMPGALSNKPPVTDPKNADTDSTNTNARTEINRQYAVGSTIRRTQHQQGQIEKLSVSVLLNSAVAPANGGWSEMEMAQFKTMVMDAVGISEERGDNLSLMTFNFTPVDIQAVPEIPWWQDATVQQPLRYIIGGMLGLAMIFFVLRPLIKHLTGTDRPQESLSVSEEDDKENFDNLQTREELEREEKINRRLSEKGITASTGLDVGNDLLPPPGSPLELQLKHLQLIANEEPARVAEILKEWVNVDEHNTIAEKSNA